MIDFGNGGDWESDSDSVWEPVWGWELQERQNNSIFVSSVKRKVLEGQLNQLASVFGFECFTPSPSGFNSSCRLWWVVWLRGEMSSLSPVDLIQFPRDVFDLDKQVRTNLFLTSKCFFPPTSTEVRRCLAMKPRSVKCFSHGPSFSHRISGAQPLTWSPLCHSFQAFSSLFISTTLSSLHKHAHTLGKPWKPYEGSVAFSLVSAQS